MPKGETNIQTMADMLRQGATLTVLSCPVCSSPLFKLKTKDLWCVQCRKRVLVVKEGKTATKVTTPVLFESLESTILTKIQELNGKIEKETNVDQLQRLGGVLSILLENLEKLRKIARR